MSANTSPYPDRLGKLRERLQTLGVDGFIVPRADEYMGEYVPPCAERLKWISGFSGSAGCAIILNDKAVVMSDGRYTIQLKQQVDTSCFDLADSTVTSPSDWLANNAKDKIIGFDPRLHTAADIKKMEEKGIALKALDKNPLDEVWDDRPAAPMAPVSIFPIEYAGQEANDKIEALAEAVKKEGAQAAVIALPDSIAWLLNIRGNDVAHTPAPLSQALLRTDGSVQLFIDAKKLSDDVRAHLGNRVEVSSPTTLESVLKVMPKDKPVWLDETRSPYWFKMVLDAAGVPITDYKDPCIDPRACKNAAEQQAMKKAHIRDGVAMVKFLHWLDEEAPKGTLDELSVEEKLLSFRAQAKEFKDTSFDTIAGFNENGAIVHYRATEKTNAKIIPPGLLLVDSGAQYIDGTTDITRTIAVGEPTDEMRAHYTHVLKGHIALSQAVFPAGTTGQELDAIARGPLQKAGLDYAHGTGHGVGCYLSVHEEAANISPRGKDAPQPGMILSNEPGYYPEGKYGIRIENLILVQETGGGENGQLSFETLTLCPYDIRLIEPGLLSDDEQEWLASYFDTLRAVLGPLLDGAMQQWLFDNTDKNIFT